jgi:general secretion pathway protein A
VYEKFFGFRERPFELTPDPKYLFLSASHKEAISNLQYAIASRKGVTVLVGEVGAGKTTLLTRTLSLCRQEGMTAVLLNNPTLTRDEFTAFLAKQFGLSDEAVTSKAACIEELEAMLKRRLEAGEGSFLIVDEAQVLPDELLEELRLLTNLETETEKLLPLILVGQPELADRLNQPELRHLKQRIALRCTLAALDLSETAAYITRRITVAGGRSAEVFTREAVSAIHAASRGLPRAISVLCDNALVTGFAAQQKPVGSAIVREVCRDFDIESIRTEPHAGATTPAAPVPDAAPPAEAAPPQPEAVAQPGPELFGQYQQRRKFSLFGMGR